MSETRSVRPVFAALFAMLVGGCDAGKAPYNEAVALDEQGKLTEAADKYDGVCRRAPDSKLCPTATSRAAAIRLKLAGQDVVALKFTDADALLKIVLESGDAESKDRARTQLASPEVMAGLAYEKAVAKTDKHAALPDMESSAASGTPIATKANEWLTKERPALLLADATTACTAKPPNACPTICDRLVTLHAGTPEAQKATGLLATYQAAEAERLYPLLVKAEDLVAQCQTLWTANAGKQKCYLNMLAANPDNAIAALAYCGDTDSTKQTKLQASLDQTIADIAVPAQTDSLKDRFKKACEEGEYEKQVPKKPSGAAAATATTGPRRVRVRCPKGSEAGGTRFGCMCIGGPDGAQAPPPPPSKECKITAGSVDEFCEYTCP
jgi:hypothetical protein